MDKQFYEGTVKSYDLSRNRHVVLYDDGDVEILNLEKERWEIVNKGHKFAKKLKLLKANSVKKGSPDKKDKVLPESRGLNDSEKTVKRKRTPKKTSRQKKRGPEETEISEEGKGGSNTADAETGCSGDDQIEAGLTGSTVGMDEPHFEEDNDDHTLGGESNENMRPMNELEGSPNFAVVTAEEEGLSNMDSLLPRHAHESEDEEVLACMEVERSPKKKKIGSIKSKSWGKSKKSAKSSSAEEGEIPDDEPLKLWKKWVGGKSDTTRR